MDRRSWFVATFTAHLTLLALVPRSVAAHGGQTGVHDHTLQVAVFAVGLLLLVGTLGAERLGNVDRRVGDVGAIAGAVAMVLALVLLWI